MIGVTRTILSVAAELDVSSLDPVQSMHQHAATSVMN